MYVFYNPSPNGGNVGDCVIRAISKALCMSWERVYIELAIQGYLMCDMPSANKVWGAYLRNKGFRRELIPDTLIGTYTVKDFCADHKNGTYVLPLSSHVIAAGDGNYYDSWDSGDEIPLYYWRKEE